MLDLLQNPEVQRLLLLNEDGLLFAIWETIYVTVLSTLFSYVIGLPLGVLVVVGEKGGVLPLPKPLMSVINVVINLLRSVPFLILMVLVIPLSRVVLGTSIGTVATIIPLIVAAFPFVARLVEASLREIDGGAWEGEPVSFIAQHYAADYALWREDIGLARCTGGESMRALQARAAAAAEDIAARSLGKTVLIATHAAFLRALLCYWQNVPLEGMKDVPWVPNASVTEVLWREKEAPVVRPAEYSFLHGQVTRLASGI